MNEDPIVPPSLALRPTELYRIYETIWRSMDREHNLINQRLGWAIFFSAGVLSASAIVVAIMSRLLDTAIRPLEVWMMGGCLILGCLAATALYFSFRVLRGVEAALDQVEYLREKYQRDEAKFKAMGLPRPFGEKKDRDRGRSASVIFPQTLILIWSAAWGFSVLAAGIFATLAVFDVSIARPLPKLASISEHPFIQLLQTFLIEG